MHIYFRCSEKEKTISNVLRWAPDGIPVTKTVILKKCWQSIQDSISEEDFIHVIHDEVSEKTLKYLNNSAKGMINFFEVPVHDWDYHGHTVELFNILETELETSSAREWHYIVEDDYLHTNNALHVMRETQKRWGGFIVPYDYPDRYKDGVATHILIGTDRHWRTIHSGTMTLAADSKLWKRYLPQFIQAAPQSNDKILDNIYTETMCINPLPGIATHLTAFHMTPLVPWKERWEEIKI